MGVVPYGVRIMSLLMYVTFRSDRINAAYLMHPYLDSGMRGNLLEKPCGTRNHLNIPS